MTGLGSTDVGQVFARPSAPRAAGLAGALKPRPAAPTPSASPQTVAAKGGGVVDVSDAARKPRPAPASQQLVVVYISPNNAHWVAERRKQTGQTNAQVILEAIEAHVDQLAAELAPAAPTRSGLFSTPSQARPPAERHVQIGLRGILPADRTVLAELVEQTSAGSLSALVRAALDLAAD